LPDTFCSLSAIEHASTINYFFINKTIDFTYPQHNYSIIMATPDIPTSATSTAENPSSSGVLRVYRSMTTDLTNSPPLVVYSPYPIKINGALVWSPGPIHIMNKEKVNIAPTEILDPEFLRGWNKLPDELKLEILSHNALFNDGFQKAEFRKIRDAESKSLDRSLFSC
jgi:hypothetical protein